jgi:hypothetical protein
MPQVSSDSIESALSFVLALSPYQRKESRAASPSSWAFSRKGFPEKNCVLLCGFILLFSIFHISDISCISKKSVTKDYGI